METVIGIFFAFLFFLFPLLIFGIAIAFTVFWIMMVIDVAQRQFKNENDKTVWLLVVILAQGIGAIIYYFVVKRNPEQYTKIEENN